MIVTRVWAMPHRWTFRIKPIAELLKRLVLDPAEWADPFAGETSPAGLTNDIRSDAPAQYHLDAVEFLKTIESGAVQGVLLDPPYSMHQATISYGTGNKVIALTPVYNETARIVAAGGLCISFGWNTNGIGKKRGFEIEQVLVIAHGGHHNDTLVTVERKL